MSDDVRALGDLINRATHKLYSAMTLPPPGCAQVWQYTVNVDALARELLHAGVRLP